MTDPTLPRADEVLRQVLAGPDTGLDGSPVVASFTAEDQTRALFACLPPDSEYVVIRRSDLAVMGLERKAVLATLAGLSAIGDEGGDDGTE